MIDLIREAAVGAIPTKPILAAFIALTAPNVSHAPSPPLIFVGGGNGNGNGNVGDNNGNGNSGNNNGNGNIGDDNGNLTGGSDRGNGHVRKIDPYSEADILRRLYRRLNEGRI